MCSNLLIIFFILLLISFVNSQRKLLEEKNSDDIVIIHANDIHCGITDNIGYDGLMLFKKELLTKYEHVLLVDAGDHIQGGALGLLSRGSDIIKIMNKLEYDVSTLGNHEFDYKLEQLYNLSDLFDNKYINAHFCYRKNKTTIFKPYKIIEAGSKKIGFIGVVTPLTLTKSYLHTLKDENGNYIYDFLTERNGQEFYEAIQKYIKDLREIEHVDYVIIIAHLGYKVDPEEYTSKVLLENLEGVDAIIDGHSHQVYNITSKDKKDNDVYIVQAGSKLSNVGILTIRDGKIISEMLSEIPLFEGYNDYKKINRDGKDRYVDPEMNQFLQDLIDSHGEEIKEYVGYTNFNLSSVDENGPISRDKENNLCNLVADSMKNYYSTDISLINSGAVRNNILKGNITYSDILTVLPFSNKVVVMKVIGQDILDSLEYAMKYLPKRSGKFVQVSGIKFKVYENIKSPVIADEYDTFVKIEGERRVFDVFIGNEKINENKTYTVAISSFMAEGGDGFTMFTKYNVTNDTDGFISDVCKEYIQNELNKTIPEMYNTSLGRIIKVKKNNSGYLIKYFGGYFLFILCLLF